MTSTYRTVFYDRALGNEASSSERAQGEVEDAVELIKAVLAGFDRTTAHDIAHAALIAQMSPSERGDKPRDEFQKFSGSRLFGILVKRSSQEDALSGVKSALTDGNADETRSAIKRFAKNLYSAFGGDSGALRPEYAVLLTLLAGQLAKASREQALSGDVAKAVEEKLNQALWAAEQGAKDGLDPTRLKAAAKQMARVLASGDVNSAEIEKTASKEEQRTKVGRAARIFIRSLIDLSPKAMRDQLYLDLSQDYAGLLTRREFHHPTVVIFERNERYAYMPSYFGHGGRKSGLLWDLPEFGPIATKIIESGDTLLSYDRLFVLYTALDAAFRRGSNRGPTRIVEIGVYKGGTSHFLAQVATARDRPFTLDVFDTFEGHDGKDLSAQDLHEPGHFRDVSAASVKTKLAPFATARVHVGRVQDNLDKMPRQIALAHLDTDLYGPTRDCLPLLFERLTPGGAIVVDDFGARSCPGIEQAVKEFALARPDAYVFGLQTGQCLVTGARWNKSLFSLSSAIRSFSRISQRS